LNEDPSNPVAFPKAFDLIQALLEKRFLNPAWPISEFFTGDRKLINENVKIVEDFAFNIIKHRKYNSMGLFDRTDLLDFFMDSKNDDGSDLTDVQLRDIILNFIIAGRDTTAQALSWG
jgi:cytochrome P450